jgi:hypothetical protein
MPVMTTDAGEARPLLSPHAVLNPGCARRRNGSGGSRGGRIKDVSAIHEIKHSIPGRYPRPPILDR